jgi:hypothetical protein
MDTETLCVCIYISPIEVKYRLLLGLGFSQVSLIVCLPLKIDLQRRLP